MRRAGLVGGLFAVAVLGVVYACGGDDPVVGSSSGDAGGSSSSSSSSGSSSSSSSSSSSGGDAALPDGGGDAAPSFDPASLGGRLVLWLKAEAQYVQADGGVRWRDQSPAKNDAVQADPARVPALSTADAGVGGHAAVRFTGQEYLQIADHASLRWAQADFAIYAVVRHFNVPPSYAIIYAKWTDVSPFPGIFLWANYPGTPADGYVTRLDTARVVSSDGGQNDGKARVVGAWKAGSRFELRIDGAKVGEIPDAGGYDPVGFDAVGRPVFLGGRPELVQMLDGDVAEIVGVKGALSVAEIGNIEAYLKTRHGL